MLDNTNNWKLGLIEMQQGNWHKIQFGKVGQVNLRKGKLIKTTYIVLDKENQIRKLDQT